MAGDPPEFDLDEFTPYMTAIVAQHLSEGLAREYRERFGISIPDWRVLVHLAGSGGASVRDIEKRVVMEKSKVSRTVARLEARKLVQKRPHADDKRLLHLSLTQDGRAMMSELLPLADWFQKRIKARLGADFEVFSRCLHRLRDDFQDGGSGVADMGEMDQLDKADRAP